MSGLPEAPGEPEVKMTGEPGSTEALATLGVRSGVRDDGRCKVSGVEQVTRCGAGDQMWGR